MITKRDLEAAIAECQGKRNPDAKTCMMLAAFYTIKKEMYGEEKDVVQPEYSYAPAPDRNGVYIESDSEFAKVVDGMDLDEFFLVIDELMSTIKIIQPRLYRAVMDKLA